jgi:hypothetical protein
MMGYYKVSNPPLVIIFRVEMEGVGLDVDIVEKGVG